jgi:hypothetical protein
VAELHDRVDVPEPVILLDDRGLQLRPEGTVSDIEMVPVNRFTAVSVIVEVDEDPGATVVGEVAITLKSWKLKIAVAVWTSPPLVPVITRM